MKSRVSLADAKQSADYADFTDKKANQLRMREARFTVEDSK